MIFPCSSKDMPQFRHSRLTDIGFWLECPNASAISFNAHNSKLLSIVSILFPPKYGFGFLLFTFIQNKVPHFYSLIFYLSDGLFNVMAYTVFICNGSLSAISPLKYTTTSSPTATSV